MIVFRACTENFSPSTEFLRCIYRLQNFCMMNKTFRTYSLCLTGHMISIPASYLPTSYPGKILLSTALASLLMFWSLAKSLGSSSLYAEHLKVSASKLRLRQGRQMLCEQWVVTGLYTMSMHTMHPNIFSTKSVSSLHKSIVIHSHNVFTNHSGLILHKKIRKFAHRE